MFAITRTSALLRVAPLLASSSRRAAVACFATEAHSSTASTAAAGSSGGSSGGGHSTPSSPTAPARKITVVKSTGPAATSFLATGEARLVDTLWFAQLAATKADKTPAGSFTPSSFAGRVVLVVNTASQCGFTPQLRDLQHLHKKYSEIGLTVLAVPCNDFEQQEPWEEERIRDFYKAVRGLLLPVRMRRHRPPPPRCPVALWVEIALNALSLETPKR